MTQTIDEQRQQLQATAARVAAKLQGFYGAFASDEQLVLDVGLSLLLEGNEDLGLEGYALADSVNPWPFFRDYLLGTGLDYAIAAVGAQR
jgi:hypothetical protein